MAAKKANEVIQLFDFISYLKGSAIIRMLSSYLGEDVFFQGVSQYLQTHQYGNARTADLWRAIGSVSGEDIDVLMSPWVQNTGYPLLSLDAEQESWCVRQSRYTMLPMNGETVETPRDGEGDPADPVWPVPVMYGGEDSRSNKRLLLKQQECIEVATTKPLKLDPGHRGFYRTLYPPEALEAFFAKTAPSPLSTEDRIGLLGDSASFVLSGHLRTPTLLGLILQLQHERTSSVRALIRNILQKVRITFGSNPRIGRGLRKFIRELIDPAVCKLRKGNSNGGNGSSYWSVSEGDTYETTSLRKYVLELAVSGAHTPEVIAEGMQKWRLWQTSETQDAMSPDLLGLMLKLAVQEGGSEAYGKIKAIFSDTARHMKANGENNDQAGSAMNVNTRELYLTALTQIQDHALILDVMNFAAHSGKLTMSETYPFASALAENVAAQDHIWAFIRDGWDHGGIKRLREIGRGKGIDHWMKRSLANVSSHETRRDMIVFFADQDVSGFDRGLKQTLEQMEINAQYRARDEQVLEDWLAAQKYLD